MKIITGISKILFKKRILLSSVASSIDLTTAPCRGKQKTSNCGVASTLSDNTKQLPSLRHISVSFTPAEIHFRAKEIVAKRLYLLNCHFSPKPTPVD